MAVPSQKLRGSVTSTRLNTSRLGATWIAKVNPQPGPQDKPAVPLPWESRAVIVKVWPVRVLSL
jgi:hypothetical protein